MTATQTQHQREIPDLVARVEAAHDLLNDSSTNLGQNCQTLAKGLEAILVNLCQGKLSETLKVALRDLKCVGVNEIDIVLFEGFQAWNNPAELRITQDGIALTWSKAAGEQTPHIFMTGPAAGKILNVTGMDPCFLAGNSHISLKDVTANLVEAALQESSFKNCVAEGLALLSQLVAHHASRVADNIKLLPK